MIMKEYLKNTEEVLKELSSSADGLESTEAGKRLAEKGKNKLKEGKATPLAIRFLKQFAEPMTIVLLVAAAISAGMAAIQGEFPTDVFIILFVVILNAVLGVVQESKAENAIAALKEISAATSKVMRNGHLCTLRSEDLTVGDIIILEAGDAVPADARIIECASMKVEEAAMTGESLPVNKTEKTLSVREGNDVPLGDRKNMVFMGSTVVYGRGKAVVTAIGMDTEMGKIAAALSNAKEEKTPLQKKLTQLSKVLTYLVLGICVVIFGVNVIRTVVSGGQLTSEVLLDTFMVAVSLAVAAIPEGLSTVVTIVLSIGVTNMSKRNAVIRKLTAVETLGCTQIICSDKTGTLTQNKMTVVEHFGAEEENIACCMALCSDAEYDAEAGDAVGEPTECALVNYAAKLGRDKNIEKIRQKRVGEVPFDSLRKMMTTVHERDDGSLIQYTKGAPDEILKRCIGILENGTVLPMTEEKRGEVLAANKNMADRALRVLAVAQKELSVFPSHFDGEELEKELIFVGMVGMIDPVRPEVKPAIDECRSAGIRPIMITGDHKDTAVAIALQLGIISDPSQALTGAELDAISEEEFADMVEDYSVYARVQPEHKTRIVHAWQKKGKVTAMTGDGVNDAPSIKNADIGVGMGITGTDVTKNVADMILTDDNFATIVSAAGEGRRIYDNIRKTIQFLLASNLSEVLTIFFATLCGFTMFGPVHLLWINLITDCLPALSLGMEKPEKDLMNRPPRNPNEGVFADGLGISVIYQGILVTLITFASYVIGRFVLADLHHAAAIAAGEYSAEMLGTSMAFLTLSMTEIFHAFNMRSLKGSVFKIRHGNPWLLGAAFCSLVLTAIVLEVPFLADAFELASLNFIEYCIALCLALSIIPIVEVIKWFLRMIERRRCRR